MKIFFTGASSFTGMWFVKALVDAGHDVTATFRGSPTSYISTRLERVKQLIPICSPVYNCSFGSDTLFHNIMQADHWDLFCHHAAEVTHYKSPEFDVSGAISNNTKNLKHLIQLLKEKKCNRILLTGSVFEQGEGEGTENLRAVSPYGLSKGLTSEYFKFFTQINKMKLAKFVIPNPYGPYEEERFTHYLMQAWLNGETPCLNNPDYQRDNIPISLLAKAYVNFAESISSNPGFEKYNPSWQPGTQREFTEKFANEIKKRLQIPCALEIQKQVDFHEPLVRINSDKIDTNKLGWNEKDSWDGIAEYYQNNFSQKHPKNKF